MNAQVELDLASQAKAYARGELTTNLLKDGYKPTGFHTYTDAVGLPIYWKVRLRHDSKGKTLRAFARNDGRTHSKTNQPYQGQFMPCEPSNAWQAAYPQGNGKKPLYRLHELFGNAEKLVFIVEGEQKVDALAELGLIATTSGSCGSVNTTDWQPLAKRTVRIWRDNDEAGIKYQDEVKAVLKSLGCDVSIVDVGVLGLPVKGDVVDWLAMRGKLNTTANDVLTLALVTDSECIKSETSQLDEINSFSYGGGSYRYVANGDDAGVYFIGKDKEGEDVKPLWLCSSLRVIAVTSDSKSSAWGRLLQWTDRANVMHKWAMPMELLAGDGSDIRRELLRQGVLMNTSKFARDRLIDYLQMSPTENQALCVDHIGWHGGVYVLPDRAAGHSDQLTVFQNPQGLEPAFSQSGSLQDWITHVAKPAQGNSRLLFSLSLSFAGTLLELANEESGGFHLRGCSSIGKSTALVIASSVWGNPSKYRRQWRTTTNGLEGLAVLHNDGLLVLDEISQCEPRDIGQAIYMLSNQQGKTRATKTGSSRVAASWRLLVLSSGEESLSSIMNQAGQRAKAGQENRLADIAADAGANMGLFERLHDTDSPNDFAKLLNDAAATYYGMAGMAWVDYLSNDRTACTQQVLVHIKTFNQHIPQAAQGQAMRVSRRFALVAAAGEMATQAGVTGWQAGEATAAAVRCFNDWLVSFGGMGNHEERTILAHVRAFIELHGSSRFESMATDGNRERIINRVGYFKETHQGKQYLVFPEAFKNEICKGFDVKQVEKVLLAHGVLKENERGGAAIVTRTPDNSKSIRMYIITDKVWGDHELPESALSSGSNGNIGNDNDSKSFNSVTTPTDELVTVVEKLLIDTAETTNNNPVTTVTSDLNNAVTSENLCNNSLVTPDTTNSECLLPDNRGSSFNDWLYS